MTNKEFARLRLGDLVEYTGRDTAYVGVIFSVICIDSLNFQAKLVGNGMTGWCFSERFEYFLDLSPRNIIRILDAL